MLQVVLAKLLELLVVSPLIFFFLKSRNRESLQLVLVFAVFYVINALLLHLPIEYAVLRITGGSWNWSGKLYAIAGSLLFLMLYRRYSLKEYFLTFRQNPDFIKKGSLSILGVLGLAGLITYFISPLKAWDTETILFQLSMPGLDEELAYRGIMLGLLCQVLKPELRLGHLSLGHPGLWVTSLLFGFAHGFALSDSFVPEFYAFSFGLTLVYGLFFAWLTLKSGSILMALLAHNLGNTLGQLIRMR